MKKNNSWIVWGIIIIAVLGILFAWPKLTDPNRNLVKSWKEIGLNCLPGHTNANLHIHMNLSIVVDGKDEEIPANTGIVDSCMAEVHTHDTTGKIHVESIDSGKTFTLGQFLQVLDKPIERPGFTLEMKVNGVVSQELDKLVLVDGQKISLTYTSTTSE
jgi:hypothetical protein